MNKKDELINYWKDSKIITDERAIEAFRKIPREKFVLPEYIGNAYNDIPLPILAGQTISQPTTVMLMTQALEAGEGDKVLEVGSGSGYQAAILNEIVGKSGKVLTIEIIPELHKFAKSNLKNYKNIKPILSDGSLGYNAEAPYDRIIVTAAAPRVPQQLIAQLKNNGILIIPVNSESVFGGQDMIRIKKNSNGKTKEENLGAFSFVPLRGKGGYE